MVPATLTFRLLDTSTLSCLIRFIGALRHRGAALPPLSRTQGKGEP